MIKRPRRNRQTPAIRSLVQETLLTSADFVIPFFVHEERKQEPISLMPKVFRHSVDSLIQEAELLHAQGIQAIALFPTVPSSLRSEDGREGWNKTSLICRTLEKLKKALPSLCVITDVALDPFTTHGHDGIVNEWGEIDNDQTLNALVKQAQCYAEAGADVIAPSDMMDGRVGVIRSALDSIGKTQTAILSYTAKYASAYYGPFRQAIQTELSFGDKKTYQMDPANKMEALREALLDEEEGADMLMIKPALPYLDVISLTKEKTSLPVGAYQVSGEYSMIMAAHEKGCLDAKQALFEALTSIKRAGADFIFTYGAPQILDLLK